MPEWSLLPDDRRPSRRSRYFVIEPTRSDPALWNLDFSAKNG